MPRLTSLTVLSLLCLQVVLSASLGSPQCSNLLDGTLLTVEEVLKDVAQREGSTVTLKCNVFASPQARISWYHNGTLVEKHGSAFVEEIGNMRSEHWLAMSIQNARLRIPCLSEADAGTYMCRAESPCGKVVEAHATVKVLPRIAGRGQCAPRMRLAPFISLFTSSRLEVDGNKIQLMCRARGDSRFVHWAVADSEGEFYHTIEKYENIKQLENGDLLIDTKGITEATLSFQCSVMNRFGSDAVEGTIVLLTN